MVSVVAEKCFDHIDLGRFRISDTEAGGILADVAGVAGCGRLVFGWVLEGRLTTGTRLPLTPSPSPRPVRFSGRGEGSREFLIGRDLTNTLFCCGPLKGPFRDVWTLVRLRRNSDEIPLLSAREPDESRV